MGSAEENRNGAERKEGHHKPRSGKSGRVAEAVSGQTESSEMYWDDVDPRLIAWLVVLVSRLGCAVTFGRSRDGGALMVAVLEDGTSTKTWIGQRDDAETKLRTLGERLDALL